MELAHGVPSSPKYNLESFNRLVADNQDDIYTLAFMVIGDKDAAERAARTAFMQAYLDLSSGNKQPFHWLVYRALVTAFRQELRRKVSVSQDAELISDEIQRSAWRGLSGLPTDLRLAVALVDLAGLNYEQAAEILGINVRQIRRRLAQARALIHSRIS